MNKVKEFASDIMEGANKGGRGECSNCGRPAEMFGDNGHEIEECFCVDCFIDEVWGWDRDTECLREMIVERYVTNNVEADVQTFRVDAFHEMKVWATYFKQVNQ